VAGLLIAHCLLARLPESYLVIKNANYRTKEKPRLAGAMNLLS
jgi:hypothetical protein